MYYFDSSLCLEAADAVKSLSGISATGIRITQEQFHRLSMSLDRSSLLALWRLIFADSLPALVSGLLGVGIEGGPVVWLRGSAGQVPWQQQQQPTPGEATV